MKRREERIKDFIIIFLTIIGIVIIVLLRYILENKSDFVFRLARRLYNGEFLW